MEVYHVVEKLIEELQRFKLDASAGVDTTRLDALLNHPDLGNLRLKVFASRIHDFLESCGNPALYRTTNDYGDCTWDVIIDDLGEVLWVLNEDSGNAAKASAYVDGFQEEYDFLSAAANAQHQLLLTRHLLELTANLEPRTKTESTPQPNRQADTVVKLARVWLDKPKATGGPTERQRLFVEKLIASGGRMSHADLSLVGDFDWEDPRKGATNMANRINTRLSNFGEPWSIIPEDNSQCLLILNSDLKARS